MSEQPRDERVQNPDETPDYHILDSMIRKTNERRLRAFKQRFEKVLPFFPEIDETITVAATHDGVSPVAVGEPNAMADPYNRIIYLNEDSCLEYITLFHELSHIAIQIRRNNGEDHPNTSEEYCSIFAVSRMPDDIVDYSVRNKIPYPSKHVLETGYD